jgi:hypothetical protein
MYRITISYFFVFSWVRGCWLALGIHVSTLLLGTDDKRGVEAAGRMRWRRLGQLRFGEGMGVGGERRGGVANKATLGVEFIGS